MNRRRSTLAVLAPPIIVFIVALIALELIVQLGNIAPYILPPPSGVAITLVRRHADLLASLFATAEAALIGFTASAIIGITIAMALAASIWIRRAFFPYTVFFQTVPIIAIAPLLVIWFDFGLTAVSASAFIASVFPVIANALAGFLSVDPNLRDLFRLYGAGRFSTLVKLTLPSALPQIITGLRVASGLAVIGAIVGEFVAGAITTGGGLGVTVMVAKKLGRTDVIFAAVLLASLLGLAMFGAVQHLGYLLLRRWHASEQ
ncbi:MAG: ABC transporter permease [Phycisphaerae bacterium]|nr:ABC transporter permease [Phycisphaerae bacterium]